MATALVTNGSIRFESGIVSFRPNGSTDWQEATGFRQESKAWAFRFEGHGWVTIRRGILVSLDQGLQKALGGKKAKKAEAPKRQQPKAELKLARSTRKVETKAYPAWEAFKKGRLAAAQKVFDRVVQPLAA